MEIIAKSAVRNNPVAIWILSLPWVSLNASFPLRRGGGLMCTVGLEGAHTAGHTCKGSERGRGGWEGVRDAVGLQSPRV